MLSVSRSSAFIVYCSIEYELYFVDSYGKADEQANITCCPIKYSSSHKLDDFELTNHRPQNNS